MFGCVPMWTSDACSLRRLSQASLEEEDVLLRLHGARQCCDVWVRANVDERCVLPAEAQPSFLGRRRRTAATPWRPSVLRCLGACQCGRAMRAPCGGSAKLPWKKKTYCCDSMAPVSAAMFGCVPMWTSDACSLRRLSQASLEEEDVLLRLHGARQCCDVWVRANVDERCVLPAEAQP